MQLNKEDFDEVIYKNDVVRYKQVMRSFTSAEKFQDNLLDVLGFLVAVRDGHRHKISVGEAISLIRKLIDNPALIS